MLLTIYLVIDTELARKLDIEPVLLWSFEGKVDLYWNIQLLVLNSYAIEFQAYDLITKW